MPAVLSSALARVGSLRVGVIGSCPLTPSWLAELVAGVRSVAELDALAAGLVGCWHLAASLGGAVRVRPGPSQSGEAHTSSDAQSAAIGTAVICSPSG